MTASGFTAKTGQVELKWGGLSVRPWPVGTLTGRSTGPLFAPTASLWPPSGAGSLFARSVSVHAHPGVPVYQWYQWYKCTSVPVQPAPRSTGQPFVPTVSCSLFLGPSSEAPATTWCLSRCNGGWRWGLAYTTQHVIYCRRCSPTSPYAGAATTPVHAATIGPVHTPSPSPAQPPPPALPPPHCPPRHRLALNTLLLS